MVEPLPTAPTQKKLLLVAIDYFSKWIEAKAFASIKDKEVIQFIWKNIMYRFGIPQSIVTDNGSQFDSQVYRNFCSELKIKKLYSTPRYSQSNNQVEAYNKTLLSALKKRLHSAKGKWLEELPRVLWSYRTTSQKPTGESPFALKFGMKAIILIEIGMPTIRTEIPEKTNTEAVVKDLDTVDELREVEVVRIASYQQRLARLHNQRVKPRTFKAKELVLIRVFENTANPTDGKFQPNWE